MKTYRPMRYRYGRAAQWFAVFYWMVPMLPLICAIVGMVLVQYLPTVVSPETVACGTKS